MNDAIQAVISLYDGKRTSGEVAEIVGISKRYARKIATRYNLPRLHTGSRRGANNHQYVSGRRIDHDGYVLITAPEGHPYIRTRKGRVAGTMFEHRLVLEQKLGRYLLQTEVVDHIDGLTLHNSPENVRLFSRNGDHLRETISGLAKNISLSGRKNIKERYLLPEGFQPVDTYDLRRRRGDVRLRQILLAALKLGIDSPYLFGTHRHLEKAGIDWSVRSNLERALDDLLKRWEEDLLL